MCTSFLGNEGLLSPEGSDTHHFFFGPLGEILIPLPPPSLHLGEPSSDMKIQGDPFKTIFVGRIVSPC